MINPVTDGAHHIGLTVPDLGAALAFFKDALGFQQVGEAPDYPAAFVSDGNIMITLWRAENPDTATAFDRRNNIGLHHLALQVRDVETLTKLAEQLGTRADTDIEFEPEALGESPMRHMMCRIPGNIRLELIAS